MEITAAATADLGVGGDTYCGWLTNSFSAIVRAQLLGAPCDIKLGDGKWNVMKDYCTREYYAADHPEHPGCRKRKEGHDAVEVCLSSKLVLLHLLLTERVTFILFNRQETGLARVSVAI